MKVREVYIACYCVVWAYYGKWQPKARWKKKRLMLGKAKEHSLSVCWSEFFHKRPESLPHIQN